jgi:exodeoxyribonuclease VII large subunit
MRIKILTVTEATAYIQRLIKSDPVLGHLTLQGEVSNFKLQSSGHMYFTLKDDGAKIPCVFFKTAMSELSFMPTDGMHIVVKGTVSVFERDGKYQFYIKSMEAAGTGDLFHRFEMMKKELQLLGYFEEDHKKRLPRNPKRIALITSKTGAALQDMLSVYRRKSPVAEIIIIPTAVQGVDAPKEIVSAMSAAEGLGVQLIILARGGGSIEELWAFNERIVADAIFKTKIPVISGVGHETDFTISDFVSDYRAPTPTAAAEASCTSRSELREEVDQLYDLLVMLLERGLDRRQTQLMSLDIKRQADTLLGSMDHKQSVLKYEYKQLQGALENKLKKTEHTLILAATMLQGNNPLKPLEKGYGLIYRENRVLSPGEALKPQDMIQLRRLDKTAICQVIEEENHEESLEL